jgi:hypothetical protein
LSPRCAARRARLLQVFAQSAKTNRIDHERFLPDRLRPAPRSVIRGL